MFDVTYEESGQSAKTDRRPAFQRMMWDTEWQRRCIINLCSGLSHDHPRNLFLAYTAINTDRLGKLENPKRY
jgi:hypothetical protein